jgi:hypothetical protein
MPFAGHSCREEGWTHLLPQPLPLAAGQLPRNVTQARRHGCFGGGISLHLHAPRPCHCPAGALRPLLLLLLLAAGCHPAQLHLHVQGGEGVEGGDGCRL